MTKLTQAQVDAFRKHPGTFPEAFQAIYDAGAAEERERAAKVCEDYAADRWKLYKGRPPYTGKEDGRADPYTAGCSDGADACADKIRSVE